ncbi:MAG: branched-chain amino acid ABC transporter permease [Alphaproteobacteria bacterium]|nr:MAG: branched-chain amino acid ABC transporter permease [Alphaproteobacteria bacterium]
MTAAALLALLAAVAVGADAAGAPYPVTLATKVAILALAGTGLNLALGLGGMVSLGHAAFFGIGGYVAAILAWHARSATPLLGWPLALGGTTEMLAIWPLAMAFAALAALAIGALSLRTSGVYFIMITLAFGQMFFYFAVSWPSYGGEDGLSFWVRNAFPGLNTMAPLPFFGLCAALLAGALLLWDRLARSAFGLALVAAARAPRRARAVGIEPERVQLAAFVVSGALTGLAGALYADLNRFVSPAMFGWQTSGELVILVILGGVGRLAGPLAGAAALVLLEELLGAVTEFWHVPLGLILLGIVLFARGGLLGLLDALAHWPGRRQAEVRHG